MHNRRLAAFLIGAWIAGSLAVAFIAVENHFGIDRIMASPSPGAATLIQKLGVQPAHQFLRYQTLEQNRYLFPRWELTQFALAALLAAVLYLGAHVNRIILVLCGIMVLLVGFMYFVLTPEITWLGRGLDFGTDPGGGGRTRFWILTALYAGLEVLKVLLGLAIAIYLFTFKPHTKVRHARVVDPLLSRGASESH